MAALAGGIGAARAQTPAPIPAPTPAPSGDPRMADRAIGSATAPVRVDEYFSLTCPHCAAFHRQTMPQVRKELIDTGKLRMVFHDFPLDQVALTAACVARSLPADRYEPFVAALLASQDRWAFARGVNSTEELWKMAALAGLSRATFDAAIADEKLKTEILQAQDAAQKTYQVDSTPTFIINGPNAKNRKEAGDRSFQDFAGLVAQAG
ncbi:MAG: DsbA family protein [Rhodospirillales bacterium]|nr:DsbA family protein [Rhodospirillales bacterium]